MPLTLICGPGFRELFESLEQRLRDRNEKSPCTPTWVLTPSSTSARFVREELARRSGRGAFVGPRVLPFSQLVDRLARDLLGTTGRRWSPLMDLLLSSLLERLPKESPLQPLAGELDSQLYLVSSLRDLADAGFTREETLLLEEIAAQQQPPGIGGELLRVYGPWLNLLDAAEVSWQPLVQGELNRTLEEIDESRLHQSLKGERGQQPAIFLYGFYDLTDVNLGTLVALARRCETRFWVPFVEDAGLPHGGFEFSQRLLEDIRLRASGLELREERLTPTAEASHFFLRTFPDGAIPARPSFLTFARASGVYSESVAAALKVQEWIEQRMKPERMLLVVPRLADYYPSLKAVFEMFRLPLRVSETEPEESDNLSTAALFFRLVTENAPVEWVLELLRRSIQVVARRGVDLDSFERKIRSLSFFGGEGWSRLSESPWSENFSQSELELICEIARLWLRDPDDLLSAADAVESLQQLADWFPEVEPLSTLQKELAHFERLWPAGRIDRATLFKLLDRLEETAPFPASEANAGVLLSPLMRARGLTADGLILLGMSSHRFPGRVEEDVVLPDALREVILAGLGELGHRLPLKSRLSEEASLLFLLFNSSAGRLHWVVPETDEGGRAVAPAPWMQRYLNAWRASGEESRRTDIIRVPRSPAEQARVLLEMDPETGRCLPPALLPLAIGRARGSRRLPRRERPSGCLEQIGQRALNVTGLEVLARCPFQFWSTYCLRLKALEPRLWEGNLSPLERGSLLHLFLEEFFRDAVGQMEDRVRAGEWLEGGGEEDAGVGRAREAVAKRLDLLSPLASHALIREIERMAGEYCRLLVTGQLESGVPLVLEERVERKWESPGLLVLGKIDRLDRRRTGLRIVDYKSGRRPWQSARERNLQLEAGFLIQPRIYPWLASTDEESRPGFSFLYLGGGAPCEEEIGLDGPVEDWLEPLAELLHSAAFLPTPREHFEVWGVADLNPCARCGLTFLCRREDPVQRRADRALLERLVPSRVEQLQRLGRKERE